MARRKRAHLQFPSPLPATRSGDAWEARTAAPPRAAEIDKTGEFPRLVLVETAPGISEDQVRQSTGAELH